MRRGGRQASTAVEGCLTRRLDRQGLFAMCVVRRLTMRIVPEATSGIALTACEVFTLIANFYFDRILCLARSSVQANCCSAVALESVLATGEFPAFNYLKNA
jgi:hypothetical protein